MSSTSKSGIQTSADGTSFIPASKRADGTTRKEIRVRPGYRPPEDVETYKNRSAEAWKSRGSGGIPGVEAVEQPKDTGENKSRNAKRREAARKKQESETSVVIAADGSLEATMEKVDISDSCARTKNEKETEQFTAVTNSEADVDRQRKIRNQLKKLRAVRELKEKKSLGEKLSHDQLMKIGKEDELLRDLRKMDYDGPELAQTSGAIDISEANAG